MCRLPERPAVYAELGRVLKPGRRLYVFEHNPRNPLVRYVIARTPIDKNAILLDATEVRHGLLDAARYEIDTDYLMFMPPGMHVPAPVSTARWRGCRSARNMSWRHARPPEGAGDGPTDL